MQRHRFRSFVKGFRTLVWLVMGVLFAAAIPAPQAMETTQAGVPEQGERDRAERDKRSKGNDSDEAQADSKKEAKNKVRAYYKKGLRVESADGNYEVRIRGRLQTRLTDLSSPDLVGEEDGIEEESGFRIRRARIKVDGHAYRPWLKLKFEYGFVINALLTFDFDVRRFEKTSLRVGQYKVLYNRERVDSSGKQQFADRSIVNSPFTIDRQQGLTLHGHLMRGSRGDSKYAFGIFTGTGRGGDLDGDRRPMYVGRWQWNFLKRDLPFSQSDIGRHKKPAASLAGGASSNVSPFTRFSSAGGGQLPGFPEASEIGQYKLEQWMAEFALMYRGFSTQNEYHFKRVEDRVNLEITELDGWYAQVGYFFSEAFETFPRPLEFALRFAEVNARKGGRVPVQRETTLAANWFFAGHDNKLTTDVSYLKNRLPGGSQDSGWRWRLQWDIQF